MPAAETTMLLTCYEQIAALCCVPCFRSDLMCSATSAVAHWLISPKFNLIKVL